MEYKQFNYYKGENDCPFDCDKTMDWQDWKFEYPKAFWWFAERMASMMFPNNEPLAVKWLFKKWIDAGSEQRAYEESYQTGNAPVIDRRNSRIYTKCKD